MVCVFRIDAPVEEKRLFEGGVYWEKICSKGGVYAFKRRGLLLKALRYFKYYQSLDSHKSLGLKFLLRSKLKILL